MASLINRDLGMAACGSPRFSHTFQSRIFARGHFCHGLLGLPRRDSSRRLLGTVRGRANRASGPRECHLERRSLAGRVGPRRSHRPILAQVRFLLKYDGISHGLLPSECNHLDLSPLTGLVARGRVHGGKALFGIAVPSPRPQRNDEGGELLVIGSAAHQDLHIMTFI